MKPTNSTLASATIGVPFAVILAWLLHTIWPNVIVPPEVVAAMSAAISIVAGLFFKGGMEPTTARNDDASPPVIKSHWIISAWILVLCILLSACQSLVAAKSLDDKIAYGFGTVASARQSASIALDSQLISVDDGKAVLKATDDARSALETALSANHSGDIKTAQGRLQFAQDLLLSARTVLCRRDNSAALCKRELP